MTTHDFPRKFHIANADELKALAAQAGVPVTDGLLVFAELVMTVERSICADMVNEYGEPDLARDILSRGGAED